MKEIIKVLLQEGIDEGMVHKVLDLIEEEYDIVEDIELAKVVTKYGSDLPAEKKDELWNKAYKIKGSKFHASKRNLGDFSTAKNRRDKKVEAVKKLPKDVMSDEDKRKAIEKAEDQFNKSFSKITK